ncbi:hypothetical protein GCG21_01745 [Pseudactinotalea sp. HY160]|uniref:hypothetical protein n=1 Tax=Pseudactinotalea sp. HY160 TaxID=2654490 RepID=UPI00128D863B|nr:hypothetical protein [Pseudactinotalea sp. HY160]MPV48753.1 hypothetical protein [Pseudactinotalea sp. HY160]
MTATITFRPRIEIGGIRTRVLAEQGSAIDLSRLGDTAVARVDAEASALGLSRNGFLRRKLEGDGPRPASRCIEPWTA